MDFYAEFEKTCTEKFPSYVQAKVPSVIRAAKEAFPDGFNEENVHNKQIANSLFFVGGGHIGRSYFFTLKLIILEFYEAISAYFISTNDIISYIKSLSLNDVEQDRELYEAYFSSLNSVIDYLSLVSLRRTGSRDALSREKAFAILSWLGIPIEDMTSILKIRYPYDRITFDDGRTVSVTDPTARVVLENYSQESIGVGFPSNRKMTYKDSRYLFRTNRVEQMTPGMLRCSIYRFNQESISFGKRISALALKQNAVFADAYSRAGQDRIDVEKCMKWNGTHSMYEKWISIYKNNNQ